jgi:hypothetical protein
MNGGNFISRTDLRKVIANFIILLVIRFIFITGSHLFDDAFA